MKNQRYTGTPTSRRQVTLPNLTPALTAGTPILVGTEPMVMLDDYQSNVAGCTCLLNGSFDLTVIARSVESPITTHAINPGDPLYASGTLDVATNVTYNLTIDAASGNTPFGRLDPTGPGIAAGATNTAAGVIL